VELKVRGLRVRELRLRELRVRVGVGELNIRVGSRAGFMYLGEP